MDSEIDRERERLRAIVATVPGVVWEAWADDRDAPPDRLGFVSDYVESMIGYSVGIWLATPGFWLSIVHPDDQERVGSQARANFTRGQDWRMEFRWIRKDGQVVWVESQVVVIKDKSGRPIGLRGLSLDITERKHAEIAVQESEARFRSLFEAIPQPIWVYDVETLQFRKVNDAAVTQYGYSREEFLSMTIKDIRLREHLPALFQQIADPTKGVGYQGIWQHQKKDGTLVDGEVFAHELLFEGRPSKLISVNDVTGRRLAERELIKSEERYRDLVENAHDMIYSHDLDGRYTSINEAGERITGYSRDEAQRMNIADTIAPEFVDKTREMIASRLRGDESTAYELELLAKDGSRVSVEVNTKLVRHDGEPVGVQGIARDITFRKQLEEQLVQAQKLESIGRLAGGIAHDFNNMLTAINGYSDLTLRQLPEDHRLRRNIEEIKKAGERSAQLTNHLLAFSRRQLLQPEILDLNEVLIDTAQILRRVIGGNIELVTDLHPSIGSIKVDRGQLSQIIMNLAVNARDAMPDGGKITITTENVFVETERSKKVELRPGAYVKLSISDTGVGISEADRQRVFEPFFTTKEIGKGTGLGLSTVYGIVKQSGGGIGISSEVGTGTTFEVFLPAVVDKEGTALDSIGNNELPYGPETILLVDDEDVVRSLLQETLQAYGYTVIAASDGLSALSICENSSSRIDLLMTDLVMPEMGGRELAEKLGSIMPDLPVLFLSGYTDDAVMRESVLDADVNFIQKPFTLDALSKKVRNLLDSSKLRNMKRQASV